ncbi:MAG: type I secretion system permease/ATPase [Alphaproteobacteria bacterium]|nr:type I secretion system permease/ATPase [Alphaproteobacteria bacterium]
MNKPTAEPIREVFLACRRSLLAVVIFSLCINLLMLTSPLYMLQLFDRVLNSRSEETLVYLTLIAALAFVTLGVLEAVRNHVLVRLNCWIDAQLSSLVLRQCVQTALHGSRHSSVQGLRDLSTTSAFLSGSGIFSILDAPWSPIFIIAIFMLHSTLGWFSVAGLILLFSLVIVSEFSTRSILNQSNAKSMKSLVDAETTVRNADVVEAMGMMPNLLNRWNQTDGESLGLRGVAYNRVGNIRAVTRSFRMLLQIGILGLGAWLALKAEVTPGAMIAGSILFGRAMAPVDQAIGSWRSAIVARDAYRRLKNHLMGVSWPAEPMQLPKPSGHLQVEGVTFFYPETTEPCIRNVNFALDPGEVLGIVGPTATGKSTLARLLIGNLTPSSGHVRLDNADVSNWDSQDLGPHVGYLPQDVELFTGSVRANIARMGDEESAAIVEAASLAEVHDVILRLKDGYETEIGHNGAVLSGGQCQRVALARALFGDPKFIVLDEPNANLDQDGENALARTLVRLGERNVTTVVVTHRLWILRHVDKILVLRDGGVEMFGPRDEILAKIARPAPAEALQTTAGPTYA